MACPLCATAPSRRRWWRSPRRWGKPCWRTTGSGRSGAGWNYAAHEAIEKEESGETKKTIFKHVATDAARRDAEAAMREMHRLLEDYAAGLARRCPG